jgi:hypothetical protein
LNSSKDGSPAKWGTGISYFKDYLARRHSLLAFRRRAREAVTHGPRIAIVQSCDDAYLPFLSVTGPVNRQYARRHSYLYFDYVGNASTIPKTGNFNRYYLLRELMSVKHLDWVFWLDADAMVIDHAMRLESFIDGSADKMLIICRGRKHYPHAINNGVFFLNLRHPLASTMLRYVIKVCELIPKRNRRRHTDQHHMYHWLVDHRTPAGKIPCIKRYTGEEADRFNYGGSFVRHVLRSEGTKLERLSELTRLSEQLQCSTPDSGETQGF